MRPVSIAVLIPSKNRAVLLRRALESVFGQSVAPDEIVVVNDGSEDDTKQYLESLKEQKRNINIIHRQVSGGVNVARNQGVQVVTSNWIAWLDDDDEFFPQAIQVMKEKLALVPENVGVVLFNATIDTGDKKFTGGYQFKDSEEYHEWLYEEIMMKRGLRGDCKPIFRKDILKQDKYIFPETVNGFESYTLSLIARDGVGVRCYPEMLTYIHLDRSIEHLSHTASAKNPMPLLILHIKQVGQHFMFYLRHPVFFGRKFIEMTKLLVHSLRALL